MLDALRAYLTERPLVDGLGPLGRRAARQAYQGQFTTALMIAGALHVSLTAAAFLLRLDSSGGQVERPAFDGSIITFLPRPLLEMEKAPEPPGGPKAPPAFAPQAGTPMPVPEAAAVFESIRQVDQIGLEGIQDSYGIGDEGGIGGGEGIGTGAGIPEVQAPPDRPDPDQAQFVEKMPVLAVGPVPAYPELARLSQLEGTVIVRALVGSDGKVRETILLKKVNDILDQAAVQATAGYVFVPAMQNGRPVAAWVTIPFRFALH